ncbi:hypothetical protein HV819_09355 [Anaerococcus sp. AGMB00486]|uniref:Uncharacterized protein n=1 Tax=Anaerococcus faecalis TaxID=2742993 RepID=A0ABX2NC13_9FIRM|nr:hypothetical protein [Anaerococcus faecalis]
MSNINKNGIVFSTVENEKTFTYLNEMIEEMTYDYILIIKNIKNLINNDKDKTIKLSIFYRK